MSNFLLNILFYRKEKFEIVSEKILSYLIYSISKFIMRKNDKNYYSCVPRVI